MDAPSTTCPPPDNLNQGLAIQALSVVCIGPDVRGRRHIVHVHCGGIVAFLCGRWRPEADVVRLETSRRHPHTCHTCGKAWERLNKESAR